MAKQFRKILVITHEASRGGAPILLLRLMKLLKEFGYVFNTLIMADGPLNAEFADLSEVCILYKKKRSTRLEKKIRQKFSLPVLSFDANNLLEGVDLIFNNTIANGYVLSQLKSKFKGPVISYIHELKMVCTNFISKHSVENTIDSSDHFFVPGKTVENFLKQEYKISPERISSLNYFIPDGKSKTSKHENLRNTLAGNASFVVGASGAVDWRKGADIFLQTAIAFFKTYPNRDVHFIWIGARKDHIETAKFSFDLEKLHCDKITMIHNEADTASFYEAIDVLYLPSREDPYPLVILEAAMYSKPAICFMDSGGATEFIEQGCGMIVPYLDILAAAKAIHAYTENAGLLEKHGGIAKQKMQELHQDRNLILQQFESVINKLPLHK